jgi:hypothetical protein
MRQEEAKRGGTRYAHPPYEGYNIATLDVKDMPDAQDKQQEAIEKAWKVLNLQADTLLKLSQTRTEVWKVAVGAMAAGGALVAATAALTGAFLYH